MKEIFAQISQPEVFVWKRLCIERTCFLSFACPIFAYSGETLEQSSKILVDTIPMPDLITMTLVQLLSYGYRFINKRMLAPETRQ